MSAMLKDRMRHPAFTNGFAGQEAALNRLNRLNHGIFSADWLVFVAITAFFLEQEILGAFHHGRQPHGLIRRHLKVALERLLQDGWVGVREVLVGFGNRIVNGARILRMGRRQ